MILRSYFLLIIYAYLHKIDINSGWPFHFNSGTLKNLIEYGTNEKKNETKVKVLTRDVFKVILEIL